MEVWSQLAESFGFALQGEVAEIRVLRCGLVRGGDEQDGPDFGVVAGFGKVFGQENAASSISINAIAQRKLI